MIKSIKFFVAFCLSIITIYVIMMFILSLFSFRNNTITQWSNNYYVPLGGSSYNRFREFKPNYFYDILFIGSSRTFRGYDPLIFKEDSLSTYNLGSSNQTLRNSYILAEDLIRSKNTSTLIVDIYSYSLSDISFESSMDLVSNIPNPSTAMKIQARELDIRTTNNFLRRLFTLNEKPVLKEKDAVAFGFCKKTNKLEHYKTISKENVKLIYDDKLKTSQSYYNTSPAEYKSSGKKNHPNYKSKPNYKGGTAPDKYTPGAMKRVCAMCKVKNDNAT